MALTAQYIGGKFDMELMQMYIAAHSPTGLYSSVVAYLMTWASAINFLGLLVNLFLYASLIYSGGKGNQRAMAAWAKFGQPLIGVLFVMFLASCTLTMIAHADFVNAL